MASAVIPIPGHCDTPANRAAVLHSVDAEEKDHYETRAERLVPATPGSVTVHLSATGAPTISGSLVDVSRSGLRCAASTRQLPAPGSCWGVSLEAVGRRFPFGTATVKRSEPGDGNSASIALAFESPAPEEFSALLEHLAPAPWVTDELRADAPVVATSYNALEHTIADFHRMDSSNLFHKCEAFYDAVRDAQQKRLFQGLYRVTLTSGLDHRITAFNPITRVEQEMICFDSNSYLNLHRHPRVIAAVKRVLDHTGFGTPSAQLLGGTNRYLRELEETISRFHSREDTVVFPSGYAANVGTMSALIRERDLVVRDRYSHASIHDGCRWTGSSLVRTYPHMDMDALDAALSVEDDNPECAGRLIVSDGVFSMHGRRANLPELLRIARKHKARLMIDEAHATGVVGRTGRGLEEHFHCEGEIDVLMGTFSKAPGSVGGYVCGGRELVYYLRFFANSGMFTAALPAPICAGVNEAFRIMEDEPWHRERLWTNVHRLVTGLRSVGYSIPDPESGILTVFVGSEHLLWPFSMDLFHHGIKAGNVSFPAVPKGEAIIRLTVNAAHTDVDIERTVEIFEKLGRRYGILDGMRPEPDEAVRHGRLEATP